MKNKLLYILCVLTLAVFVLIYVQERTKLFKLKPLNGVYYTPEKVDFTLDNFLSGKYQQSIDNNLRYNFGFREIFIRFYNQYIWDFYHKSTNKIVKIGKEDWLFGLNEIKNFYESDTYEYANDKNGMKRKFDLEASRMYKVQNILEEYNVFIFVTLLPGKAFLYPEYLPESPEPTREPFHAIEYFPHVFDSLKINYITVMKMFEDQKGKADYPLFYKTGMHWSYIAAQHAFDSVIKYVEAKGNMNLNNFSIGEKYTAQAKHPDTDLEDLLNLMRPMNLNSFYYSEYQLINDSTATKPIFILIGDSFFWNIVSSVPLDDIFKKHYYWYYNSTIHFDSRYDNTSQVDILEEILNSGVIDLSYSPRQLYLFSNKFLPKALLYLTHEDSEIDSTLCIIADSIEGSDEVMIKSAKDILFSEPEKYFTDLAGDSIPTTRNSRIQEILKNRIN